MLNSKYFISLKRKSSFQLRTLLLYQISIYIPSVHKAQPNFIGAMRPPAAVSFAHRCRKIKEIQFMSISYLLFFAMFISTLLGAGKTLEMYDPSKTPRWNSQHGWNLSILRLTDEEFDYLCHVLAWKGYKYATICYAVIAIALIIILYPNERVILATTFFLCIATELLALVVMVILTKRHSKHIDTGK